MTNETLSLVAPILGAESLSDTPEGEQALIAGVQSLARERDAAIAARTTAEQELATERANIEQTVAQRVRAGTLTTQVDALLVTAYRDGRLLYARDGENKPLPSPREARLRKIADKDGLDALQAELAEMPVIVPLGRRVVQESSSGTLAGAGEPTRAVVPSDNTTVNPALSAVASQLGLDASDVEATYRRLAGEDETPAIGEP